MEEEWYQARCQLRDLSREHPTWTQQELATELGQSRSWVKKWIKRLKTTSGEQALCGLSRRRHSNPQRVSASVVERILEIRDDPPQNLHRVPGPVAILYYLHHDPQLQQTLEYLPRSTSTIWHILNQFGRIRRPRRVEHEPESRPEPLSEWQIDFKDITSVAPDPDGKQAHVVEVMNVIDKGSSILLDALPRSDYTMERVILALTNTFLTSGLPDQITCDRDSRFVGGHAGKDFPTAFIRYLMCLGIKPDICPPRRPDRNGFVERFHRSYDEECLQVYLPRTLEQVYEVTTNYQEHYNHERPHQGITCGNQPPCVAFPRLPYRPALPDMIDPDGWLNALHKRAYMRSISSSGRIQVGRQFYYIGRDYQGCRVAVEIDAEHRQFVVHQGSNIIKRIDIKGLYQQTISFEEYLSLICEEARVEWRLLLKTKKRNRGSR